MAIQVTEAQQALKNIKKDITDVSVTVFTQWCDFINKKMYRYVKSTDPERFIKEVTLSYTSGINSVTLPVDFRDVSEYGSGVFQINTNGNVEEIGMARTEPNSIYRGFWVKGGTLYLTPTPNDSGSILLRYLPTSPVTISSLSQYLTMDGTLTGGETIPSEYLEALRDLLVVMYDQWDETPDMEGFESQRVVNSLGELAATIRKEPETYFMPDLSTYWA